MNDITESTKISELVVENVNTYDQRFWAGRIEPGNGGAYSYIVWHQAAPLDRQWFVAVPDFGTSARIGNIVHHDYISEKLRVSTPDAKVIAEIINTCQRLAGAA